MADSTTQDTGTAPNDAGETQGTASAAGAPAGASTTTDTTQTAADTQGAEGAGEAVEYTFDAPEGIDLDAAQVDEFKAIAKELKLSAEDAKKIAGISIKAEAARREAFAKQVEGWGATVSADKELGNAENQAAMRQVVDKFGTPELKSLLNSTGMGNHPELARFVFNVSKAISEDAVKGKATGAPPPTDAASLLYPNNAKA